MIKRFQQWWNGLNSTAKSFFILIIFLIIGIIIRWDFIIEGVTKSMNVFQK